MVAALREQGWDVPEAQGNFVWLPLGDDAMDFAAACDPVSVRPFAGDGVRISVGAPEVNAEFVALAAEMARQNTRSERADLRCLAGPPTTGYDRGKRDASHARVIADSPTTPCDSTISPLRTSVRRPRCQLIEGVA